MPSNCKVGVGTTTPAEALEVKDGKVTFTSAQVNHGMTDILPTNAYFMYQMDTGYSGGVGLIGATSNDNGVPFNFQGVLGTSTPSSGHAAIWFHAYKKNGTSWQALASTDTAFRFRSSINDLMTVMGNGDVIVSGSLTANNVIGAVYEDLAEWVPSANDLEVGTVVVLDPSHDNQVRASSSPYDTSVAGVVSEKPGVILGTASPNKEKIATTGRVRVKVSAAGGAIEIGDLLVTSDKSGVAMKSSPVDVSGIKLHRPGTIIGKALQAWPAGEGEILVLLSLQ